jgi:biphenyl-2,3-diol 1,2-dioxygenase
MSLITGLGYVGLGVKNVDAWESFGTQILGLENGGCTDDGRQLLRMDEYEYRFALHHDDADDIAYAGWEVADASGLREIAERLRTIGVEVSAGTTEDTKIRRVTELIKFTDPNGVACEAFYGPWIQFEKPFHSPRPISGFVTGPQGLGHIVMTASDIEKSLRFYLDGLGFRISDTIDMKLGRGGGDDDLYALQRPSSLPRVGTFSGAEAPLPRHDTGQINRRCWFHDVPRPGPQHRDRIDAWPSHQ